MKIKLALEDLNRITTIDYQTNKNMLKKLIVLD